MFKEMVYFSQVRSETEGMVEMRLSSRDVLVLPPYLTYLTLPDRDLEHVPLLASLGC